MWGCTQQTLLSKQHKCEIDIAAVTLTTCGEIWALQDCAGCVICFTVHALGMVLLPRM